MFLLLPTFLVVCFSDLDLFDWHFGLVTTRGLCSLSLNSDSGLSISLLVELVTKVLIKSFINPNNFALLCSIPWTVKRTQHCMRVKLGRSTL